MPNGSGLLPSGLALAPAFGGAAPDRADGRGKGQPQADRDHHGGHVTERADAHVAADDAGEQHEEPCAHEEHRSGREQPEERVHVITFRGGTPERSARTAWYGRASAAGTSCDRRAAPSRTAAEPRAPLSRRPGPKPTGRR